jgi:hypothetical protein
VAAVSARCILEGVPEARPTLLPSLPLACFCRSRQGRRQNRHLPCFSGAYPAPDLADARREVTMARVVKKADKDTGDQRRRP